MFKSKTETNKKSFWNDLTSEISLSDIDDFSRSIPVLLFKHSTRCSVSFMAKAQLDQNWDIDEKQLKPYYLDLLQHRSISNEIAERYGVVHESPQVLLIKNGKCIYHTSHSNISVREIKQNL